MKKEKPVDKTTEASSYLFRTLSYCFGQHLSPLAIQDLAKAIEGLVDAKIREHRLRTK